MSDFYLFVATYGRYFWGLLPAGALFGFDELAKLYFPAVAKRLDIVSPRLRRYAEILILLCISFFAGFQAWDEEHKARVAGEAALASHASGTTVSSDSDCDGVDKGTVTEHDVAYFTRILKAEKNPIVANNQIRPFCGMRLNFTGRIINMVSGSTEGVAVLIYSPPLEDLSCMFKPDQTAYLSRKAEGEIVAGTGVISNQNFDGTMFLSDCKPGKLSPTSDP